MTEPDLRSEIAAIKTSLRHIEGQLAEAHEHRSQQSRDWTDYVSRLVRLETGGANIADLPSRVAHNEVENAVADAVRQERQDTIRSIRATILAGFGIAGTVGSLIAVVLPYLLRGGS